MNKLKEKPKLKNEIENRLNRLANVLLLNASFIDSPGLLNGKMGIAIFFYRYGRYSGNKVFTDYAGELIDEIYEEISKNTTVDFTNGITGIGWGIEYLVENKFVDADTDESLADIDKAVNSGIYNSSVLLDNGNDLFGYGFYFLSRLRGHENDDDNLNTLIKKEHLIYMTDECERLLVHRRYLEFNILQLSVATINSLLWFLLEINRIGLFPSKVIKVLKYLPDYISVGEKDINNRTDWYILHELAQIAASQLTDTALQKQYRILFERTGNELKNRINNSESVLEDLQSISLQKLIYRPYINDTISDKGSFEKAFGIIDNEENWNRVIIGLNKSNMGLTGLAGTGLFLLDAISSYVTTSMKSNMQKEFNSVK
jgi:hypothetical protein